VADTVPLQETNQGIPQLRYPTIVASFERLFCDIAAFRKVGAKTLSDAKKLFNDLRQHVRQETAGC
jgi:hypothetical protein